MSNFLAIGNPVFDIIETPFARTDGRVLSGCSVNAALAIGKLGKEATLIGSIGEDFRELTLRKLSEYNVKAHLQQSKETGGFHLIYLDETMNDRKLTILGHADKIDIKSVRTELFEASDIIILGPILDELSLNDVKYIKRMADSIILNDPQGFLRVIEDGKIVRRRPKETTELISLSDIFKPNEHEAQVLFPGLTYVEIARKISKINGNIGIVTLAEKGSIVSFDGKTYRIVAYPSKAVDPTGCGDVYGGAFAFHYQKTEDPLESAAFASAAASFMVENIGPDFPLPKKELEERFEYILERIEKVI